MDSSGSGSNKKNPDPPHEKEKDSDKGAADDNLLNSPKKGSSLHKTNSNVSSDKKKHVKFANLPPPMVKLSPPAASDHAKNPLTQLSKYIPKKSTHSLSPLKVFNSGQSQQKFVKAVQEVNILKKISKIDKDHHDKDKKKKNALADFIMALTRSKKDISKSEESIASSVIRVLRNKVHEGGDLNRLKEFKIPDQKQMLTTVLPSDHITYDFGGFLRLYLSPVLRNYAHINMLERYRGISPLSPALSSVNISELDIKDTFEEKIRLEKQRKRDVILNELHEASADESHYLFLKELAINQPVSLPLTIIHDMAKEILPLTNRMQKCTQQNII